jgi:hypothetical protein
MVTGAGKLLVRTGCQGHRDFDWVKYANRQWNVPEATLGSSCLHRPGHEFLPWLKELLRGTDASFEIVIQERNWGRCLTLNSRPSIS